MSKEAVIELIKAAENNPTLLQQLQSAEGAETILEIAQEKGYKFTEAQLLEVMQEKQISFTSDELSEEQLEAVAGGKTKYDVSAEESVTYNAKTKS